MARAFVIVIWLAAMAVVGYSVRVKAADLRVPHLRKTITFNEAMHCKNDALRFCSPNDIALYLGGEPEPVLRCLKRNHPKLLPECKAIFK